MRLADIEIGELIRALGRERSKWIDVAKQEGRKRTDAESATICFLAALEHVLDDAAFQSETRRGRDKPS